MVDENISNRKSVCVLLPDIGHTIQGKVEINSTNDFNLWMVLLNWADYGWASTTTTIDGFVSLLKKLFDIDVDFLNNQLEIQIYDDTDGNRSSEVDTLAAVKVCTKGSISGVSKASIRELIANWVSNNDDTVADASSSQSRTDLLTIGLAVTNILAGLVWRSIHPKTIYVVPPRGVECERKHSNIPDIVASELSWAWESLSVVACCRIEMSFFISYDAQDILR